MRYRYPAPRLIRRIDIVTGTALIRVSSASGVSRPSHTAYRPDGAPLPLRYWWECPIGVEHYSVREAARWAVYWDQSCADRAAHRAALVRLRPRMSARTDEGISEASWNMAAMRAVEGWMPRWTSCP